MGNLASDVAFTPAVKAIQERRGSRQSYARMEMARGWQTKITADLAEFIESLDMFYLGTASREGQPYIQHRGGPVGFLKIIDENTLGFADFSGNRQYITQGNLSENSKACIFLMEYANRQRVKLWGTAKVIEDNPTLFEQLSDPSYPATVERAILFTVAAWDMNCSQHIHKRFAEQDVAVVVDRLQNRIRDLESEIALLRNENVAQSTANPVDSGAAN